MYNRQEASAVKSNFWTQFGKYMKPVPGAEGTAVNWINYKTGIRHLFFRMNVTSTEATVAIELRQDAEQRHQYFERFQQTRSLLEQYTGETWNWQPAHITDDGEEIARIGTRLEGVNVFREGDWPAIISFLKQRIIALDKYWSVVKDLMEG